MHRFGPNCRRKPAPGHQLILARGLGMIAPTKPLTRRFVLMRNLWLTAEECKNLNALFGVAYRETQRFSVPQLGYLGYRVASQPLALRWHYQVRLELLPLILRLLCRC
jgi:hypothetical protein